MSEEVVVSPFRCTVWQEHARSEESVNEDSCRSEIDSVLAHGQLVPALGRRPKGANEFDVEIICGARRLFVARHLNVPLRVEMRDLSDREAAVLLEIENSQRQDLSPYERGRAYAQWLRGGIFQSQDDLSRALRVSRSQVSRLLAVARLPPVIVSAFSSPTHICETWGVALSTAWADPYRRQILADTARGITKGGTRLDSGGVYRVLSGCFLRHRAPTSRDEVIQGTDGEPLFRVCFRGKTVSFQFSADSLSSESLGCLKSAISAIMQPGASAGGPRNVRRSPSASQRIITAASLAGLFMLCGIAVWPS